MWVALVAVLFMGCNEAPPEYDAHVIDYYQAKQPSHHCGIAVGGGGMGIPLGGGCGWQPVLHFNGTIGFGVGL